MSDAKKVIAEGSTFLGIEFGSTRIKAVLTILLHRVHSAGKTSWLTESGRMDLMTSKKV